MAIRLEDEPGVVVTLTRNRDGFLPTANRLQIAGAVGADLLISLQAYTAAPDDRGALVWSFADAGDLALMRHEVFGPILPLVPYDTTKQALEVVTTRDRPLALYVFAENRRDCDPWLHLTHSGGLCVNEVAIQFSCDTLPFGGVGASGYGAYHGEKGFETFSHMKSVLEQSRLSGLGLLAPPFTARTRRLVKLLNRFV